MKRQRALEKDIAERKSRRRERYPGNSPKSSRKWKIWWEVPILIGLTGCGLHLIGIIPLLKESFPGAQYKPSNGKICDTCTFEPANGVFPEGCKWREVIRQKQSHVWAVKEYQYWDIDSKEWNEDVPKACFLSGENGQKGTNWKAGTPKSQVFCDDQSCIYQNLWYNAGRWYLLIGDGTEPVEWWMMSRDVDLHPLHVKNSTDFVENIDFRVVRGDSLILDYIFFTHPTAIGHWGEMLYPLYSVWKNETEFKIPPDQFVLLNVKRGHLMEWVREILAVSLSIGERDNLPPIYLQRDQDDVNAQIREPLEGIPTDTWVCFERALVVRDHLFSGGVQTFFRTEDAQDFRSNVYKRFGLHEPKWQIPPRKITFQRKSANRRIVNEAEFLSLLAEYGEVKIVEFNPSTPFKDQIEIIADTGVFISVHTSNLANAQFLKPGSAVFEIVQRNWAWADMDRSFKVQTEVMGDIHHFAWRAQKLEQTTYLNARDQERFANWGPEDCVIEDCVEAHTNVDVMVDIEEFRELLDSRLPLIFSGTSVKDAELPWPKASSEDTKIPSGTTIDELLFEEKAFDPSISEDHEDMGPERFRQIEESDTEAQICDPSEDNLDISINEVEIDAAVYFSVASGSSKENVKKGIYFDQTSEEDTDSSEQKPKQPRTQPRRGDGSLHD